MSAGVWLELDLLRQRRKDFGQIRSNLVPTGSLLRRGAVAGAVLPALLILASGWLLLRDYVLTGKLQSLESAAQVHAQVDKAIKVVEAEVNQLSMENNEVAQAMADVRSSSAFLTELQRILDALKLTFASEQQLTLTGAGIPDRGSKTLCVHAGVEGIFFFGDEFCTTHSSFSQSSSEEPAIELRIEGSLC